MWLYLHVYLSATCWLGLSEEAVSRPHVVHFDDPLYQSSVVNISQPFIILNSSAVVVYLNPRELLDLQRSGDVNGITDYPPESKYAESTLRRLTEEAGDSAPVQLILLVSTVHAERELDGSFISLLEIVSVDGVDRGVEERDAGETHTVVVTVNSDVAAATMQALAARDAVLWVEERHAYHTFNRWAVGVCSNDGAAVAECAAQERGHSSLTGEGQVIGISDTGIDMQSCFFKDDSASFIYDSLNPAHRKILYYHTQFGDRMDSAAGHGTHVAGSLAGSTSQTGYSLYNGIASAAKVSFFDLHSSGPEGELSVPSDLSKIFLPLYATGARVISNSWGMPNYSELSNSYTLDSRAVDMFMYIYPDSLIIFAAGNNGALGENSVVAPSTNKNGISVGASLNSRGGIVAVKGVGISDAYNEEGVAHFSSRGPTRDGRMKPDVLAPGWVTSSAAVGRACGLVVMEGTSMATPLVAGVASRVREYFMKGYYPTGYANVSDEFTPSGALLKAILIHSSQPMARRVFEGGSSETLGAYPSNEQGYGRVSIDRILAPVVSDSTRLFVRGAAHATDPYYVSFNETGQRHLYEIVVGWRPPRVLRVTVTYTDFPAFPTMENMIINRLSVVVRDGTSGQLYSRINSAWEKDNVFVIDIHDPLANSTLLVNILAEFLLSEQSYALVVSGLSWGHACETELTVLPMQTYVRFVSKLIALCAMLVVVWLGVTRYSFFALKKCDAVEAVVFREEHDVGIKSYCSDVTETSSA